MKVPAMKNNTFLLTLISSDMEVLSKYSIYNLCKLSCKKASG